MEPDRQKGMYVVLMGAARDTFIRDCERILEEYEVEYRRAEDIYEGMAVVSGVEDGRRVLVVGRVREVAREDGRFLAKVREKGMLCCCLSSDKRDEILKPFLTAGGFFPVYDVGEVEEILAELLLSAGGSEKEGGFKKGDFLVTQSELDALFGAA